MWENSKLLFERAIKKNPEQQTNLKSSSTNIARSEENTKIIPEIIVAIAYVMHLIIGSIIENENKSETRKKR